MRNDVDSKSKYINPKTPSPLRYPGGKSWLVPTVVTWLESLETAPYCLIEPFAGGANVGISMLMQGKVKKLVIGEKDERLIALWETVLHDATWLNNQITNFKKRRRDLLQVLEAEPKSRRKLAFQTLLRNRTSRAGIIASGGGLLKSGDRGNGVFSRWYPETLVSRISAINALNADIEFVPGDAIDLIQGRKAGRRNAFFVDPPYSIGEGSAGRRLYDHFEISHARLFKVLDGIQGSFLISYENSKLISALAREADFCTKRIRMRSSHHAEMKELIITKPLS